MNPLKCHLFRRNFMHSLDVKPLMSRRHRVKQSHWTLFWDDTETKYPGHLFHEIKIINIFPGKSKPSKPHIQNQNIFFKQEQVKSVKPQQDKTGELCPTCGISSAKHKYSDSLTLSASCTSRQADPNISLLHKPGNVTVSQWQHIWQDGTSAS